MSESPKVKCPKCGTQAKKLVTGGSGFILVGDGWPGKDIKNGKKENKT
jgi:predicted nucleic acid-binding Zn ribbon protein